MNLRILVVDDEPSIRLAATDLLSDAGYDVRAVTDAAAALDAVAVGNVDLVISDVRMPGALDGFGLLERLQREHPGLPVVLMTAHGDERLAVRALKAGGWDYLPKPFDNEELLALARRAQERHGLQQDVAQLRVRFGVGDGGLLGTSAAMQHVRDLVARLGPTDATVLVTGESGTGKELVARALHASGRRARRPFIAVNCGALPRELVESELFGHRRGAFTGATAARAGHFAAADGGTIFLDEIGELPAAAQAALLRVLEQREVLPVGASVPVKVDVRVIAATHRDLETEVTAGRFREDLRYRLAVIELPLPPLRHRGSDIALLADAFAADAARKHGRPPRGFTPDAIARLERYGWPGNIRELRNAVERAVLLSDGAALEPQALPAEIAASNSAMSAASGPFLEARASALAAFDREYLRALLERCGGNVSEAARQAGLARQSLQRILARSEL